MDTAAGADGETRPFEMRALVLVTTRAADNGVQLALRLAFFEPVQYVLTSEVSFFGGDLIRRWNHPSSDRVMTASHSFVTTF